MYACMSSRSFENVIAQWTFLRPTVFLGQKVSPNEVAIIKTRSATIVFFSSPSFLLLALSFSPFFSFVTVILKLLGLKKPAF